MVDGAVQKVQVDHAEADIRGYVDFFFQLNLLPHHLLCSQGITHYAFTLKN